MKSLQGYRSQIEKIDASLLGLLQKRMEVSRAIGKLKKQEGAMIQDRKREQEIMKDVISYANMRGLTVDFVQSLWRRILQESRRVQRND
ncbi:chorismate mutase [Candidatus Uhrbacteria bacterium]|nr:chorismate mutase [Candidatus Uhrbacteria bacterium]